MTSAPHRLSQYRDDNVWVVFCKVCSAEGEKLKIPCPGEYVEKKKPPHSNADRRDIEAAKKALDEGDFISLDEFKKLDKDTEPT